MLPRPKKRLGQHFLTDRHYLDRIVAEIARVGDLFLPADESFIELARQKGLVAEAKQTFGLVIDEYVKRNRIREAGEVLGRMAAVDPSDIKVRIRLAELYGRYQQAEFAADLWQVHLGQGSDEYKKPQEFFRRTYLTESL